jgi:hypothetical protein
MPVTETFRVREVDGTREYLVIATRADISTSTLDRRSFLPGISHYRLADGGGSLSMVDNDTFVIIRTGTRVRRIA